MVKSDREKKSFAEIVFYFSLAIACIGMLVYLGLQPGAYKLIVSGGLSSVTFPTIFISLLLIASISGALSDIRPKKSSKQMTEGERFHFWPVFWVCFGMVVSVFWLWNLDPISSSGALVLVLLLVGGIRDWRLLLGLPVGMALVIYIVFILILDVYFPYMWL